MTAPAPQSDLMDQALEAISMLLMPFFLLGAGDDPEKARNAVAAMIRAYNPSTIQELDLVARIIGFSTAALDNLRLSMGGPTLSDSKILRYRSTAVSLSRSAEQCRATLQKMQTEQAETQHARQPEKQTAALRISAPQPNAQPNAQPAMPKAALPPMSPASIEKAKAEARTMLAGLAKAGAACAPGNGMTAAHLHPDPGAQITASITAALAEMKNPRAGQIPPR
jgi:hypothetical protein